MALDILRQLELISGDTEGLYCDSIWVFGGREHGEERSDFAGALGGVAVGADDGDVAGAGVGDEDEVAVAGEGKGVGAASDLNHVDALAVVDGVDADGVGAEVGDPERGVVGADDAVRRAGRR